MSQSRSTDLSDQIDIHSHSVVMLPFLWKSYQPPPALSWKSVKLEKPSLLQVPSTNGVYTLDVCPHVASHKNHAYIMYVGSGNLRDRFSKYLKKRPSNDDLKKVLEKYEGYIYFSFFTVSDKTYKTKEEALYTAIYPPYNKMGLTLAAILDRTPKTAF